MLENNFLRYVFISVCWHGIGIVRDEYELYLKRNRKNRTIQKNTQKENFVLMIMIKVSFISTFLLYTLIDEWEKI